MYSFKPIRCRLLSLERDMRRREFIKVIACSAAAWPLAVRAQQPALLRVGATSVQPRTEPIHAAFEQRMAELGYDKNRFVFEFIQAPNFEAVSYTHLRAHETR